MKGGNFAIAVVVILLLCSAGPAVSAEDAGPTGTFDLLLDFGNGEIEWIPYGSAPDIGGAIAGALDSAGHPYDPGFTVIDGRGPVVIGGADTGGSFTVPGTTGITVATYWHIYLWNGSGWVVETDLGKAAEGHIALGFYPDGTVPISTPEHRAVWTMIGHDSSNSYNQVAEISATESGPAFDEFPDSDVNGVYGAILYAEGLAFVKYGNSQTSYRDPAGKTQHYYHSVIRCYDTSDWSEKWAFTYPTSMLETTTPLLVGGYIFVQAMDKYGIAKGGCIYRIPIDAGPGTDNVNVVSFNCEGWDTSTTIPNKTGASLVGSAYGYGTGSLVYDSGAIFCKSSNGMVYAFDTDLQLLWSYQTQGSNYFAPVTIVDGMLFAGTFDGNLYVLDTRDGSYIARQEICHASDVAPGSVGVPGIVRNGDHYDIFISYSDGGVFSSFNGYGAYTFDGTSFTRIFDVNGLGGVSTFMTHYEFQGRKAVIFPHFDSMDLMEIIDGELVRTPITTFFGGNYTTHVAPTLVNGTTLFTSTYNQGTPGSDDAQAIYSMDIDGQITGRYTAPVLQYAMTPVVIVDGLILCGNDAGFYTYHGPLGEYSPPVNNDMPFWMILAYAAGATFLAVSAFWCALRFGFGWKSPFADLRDHVMRYFYGEEYTHNTKSKRRLRVVVLFGILITLGMGVVSLCVGSELTVGVGEALSAMVSSISKGGHHLDTLEMLIYNQRLPRVIATISVGIGLSVAGAVYQAVIKNPLVEPYIMGVSSGAGTFAVAVITYGFTFFGLFNVQSPYLIATAAIFGGLLAFALTMGLAVKTGGKSVNFVLSGIIIGLVFSAIQSIMMVGSGTKASNALSWLYGTFINISWETVWFIVFPCIFLSFIPMVWARELNLILLGEDQAKQMGLEARRFDAAMLITVSVLTAFCVAFCGIIGFVGLVIPHLSRLLLGGDHRLMLPASMAFGGFLLVTADLLSRILLVGYELPVGAITTVIGVPVFAYLLIRRGRKYDV